MSVNWMKGVLALSLAGLVLVSGCSHEAEQLRQRVVAQSDSLATFRSNLEVTTDSLHATVATLQVYKLALDSANMAKAEAIKRAESLSRRVHRLNATNDSLKAGQDSLVRQLDVVRAQLGRTSAAVIDSSRMLVVARSTSAALIDTLSTRQNFINALKPWYDKWRHDATQRNWLEKLFGADKAKSPDFPEPVFPGSDTTAAL